MESWRPGSTRDLHADMTKLAMSIVTKTLLDVDTGDSARVVSKSVDVTFEYTGAATDPFGNQRVGLEGSVVINRKDFGVSWNAALEGGGVLVSEKVTLELEVSAIKNA